MNFKPAPITLNYSIRRFVSENGRWELGITPVLFGVRIRAGLANNEWCVVDYCAGDNWVFAVQLLATMMIILESFPESAGEREVSRILPRWERRTIDRDACWPQLQALAAEILARKEKVAA